MGCRLQMVGAFDGGQHKLESPLDLFFKSRLHLVTLVDVDLLYVLKPDGLGHRVATCVLIDLNRLSSVVDQEVPFEVLVLVKKVRFLSSLL